MTAPQTAGISEVSEREKRCEYNEHLGNEDEETEIENDNGKSLRVR